VAIRSGPVRNSVGNAAENLPDLFFLFLLPGPKKSRFDPAIFFFAGTLLQYLLFSGRLSV
jgi:hypothetical protein